MEQVLLRSKLTLARSGRHQSPCVLAEVVHELVHLFREKKLMGRLGRQCSGVFILGLASSHVLALLV